jgi:predicted peptidase
MQLRVKRLLFTAAVALVLAVAVVGHSVGSGPRLDSFTADAPPAQAHERSAPKPTATREPTATSTPARASSWTSPPEMDGYFTETFTDTSDMSMTYYLHIPDGYVPFHSYPLVLLLHGVGEVASTTNTPQQNASVLLSQPYAQVWTSPSVQSNWPSFIVVPQVVSPNRWVNVPSGGSSYTLQPQPSDSLRAAMEIVSLLTKAFPGIDTHRIYITGISMGAFGVWDAIERWPTYFAAAMPLAGAGDPSRAAELIHLPVWDFHGSDDPIAPVSGSRDMYAAIQAAGGSSCYTEFAGAAHTIWMQVYGDRTVIAWLFAQGTPAANSPSIQHCSV